MPNSYDQAVAVAVPIVQAIGDDQLDNPTPCADFTVRQLLGHLFQVVEQFTRSARGEAMDWSGETDYLVGDWRTDFADRARRLATAWSDPAAMEIDDSVMGIPRATAAVMPIGDLVVHAWDLAVATGRQYHCDHRVVEVVNEFVTGIGPMARQNGVFGEAVMVPQDAPALDRLLGASGRDPQWKP